MILVSLLILSAGGAAAQSELRITPANSGPINCDSQTGTLAFRYIPDPGAPPLRGYELIVDRSHSLVFGPGDVVDSGILAGLGDQYFDVVDNGDGTVTVAAALLGGEVGLETAADLFTVDFHGNHNGTGSVDVVHYKLRDLSNGDIFADLYGAEVAVDCLPPLTPTPFPEPPFTAGDINTLSWTDETASGATAYLMQGAEDPAFSLGLFDSGWVTGLGHSFGGLVDGQIYYYRIRSRDALENASAWSDSVFSTQDASPPTSAADPLPPYQSSSPFDLHFTAADATSGLATIELWVDVDGGGYTLVASSAASPFSFSPSGDGLHSFHTIGVDAVGNREEVPGTPDAVTTVDLSPPAGSFVIDGGSGFTQDLTVALNSAVTDANPPIEMRFSNDGVTWSAWLPYTSSLGWSLTAGADGLRTVRAEYRDLLDNLLALQDDIVLDTQHPAPVSNMIALPEHESILLSWTDSPSPDVGYLEIYRGTWHDGGGATAYPEYDDLPADAQPQRPADRSAALANPEWVLAGVAAPGDEQFTDEWAERGIHFYEIFAADGAFNFSLAAAANAMATNYWLGDVRNWEDGPEDYDGLVNAADISELGAAFNTGDGDPDYYAEVDVGPTHDDSRRGLPLTDDLIDFEDLMIFALNYGVVMPQEPPTGDDAGPRLLWRQAGERVWSLELLAPCSRLKGLRLRAGLPAGVVSTLVAGSALVHQDPYFLIDGGMGRLDLNLAILGEGRAIEGSGELFRVTLSGEGAPGEAELIARDLENIPMPVDLASTGADELPGLYRLGQNHPNPFNPKTMIRFDLPAAQDVSLAIFGTDGRRIATLVDGPLTAGFHAVPWDGREDGGGHAASGVYLYRIAAGPLRETRKMLLLK
jgi:hypothetical protein